MISSSIFKITKKIVRIAQITTGSSDSNTIFELHEYGQVISVKNIIYQNKEIFENNQKYEFHITR